MNLNASVAQLVERIVEADSACSSTLHGGTKLWGVSLIGKTIALQAIVRGSIPLPSTILYGNVV